MRPRNARRKAPSDSWVRKRRAARSRNLATPASVRAWNSERALAVKCAFCSFWLSSSVGPSPPGPVCGGEPGRRSPGRPARCCLWVAVGGSIQQAADGQNQPKHAGDLVRLVQISADQETDECHSRGDSYRASRPDPQSTCRSHGAPPRRLLLPARLGRPGGVPQEDWQQDDGQADPGKRKSCEDVDPVHTRSNHGCEGPAGAPKTAREIVQWASTCWSCGHRTRPSRP